MVAGPALWNSIPGNVKSAGSFFLALLVNSPFCNWLILHSATADTTTHWRLRYLNGHNFCLITLFWCTLIKMFLKLDPNFLTGVYCDHVGYPSLWCIDCYGMIWVQLLLSWGYGSHNLGYWHVAGRDVMLSVTRGDEGWLVYRCRGPVAYGEAGCNNLWSCVTSNCSSMTSILTGITCLMWASVKSLIWGE